ncbi:TPA: Ldh family oxidoreductase [Burkholderia cenocepacia]|nr:Ldh family oxidoreductase [Burkholderia cenocepacia]
MTEIPVSADLLTSLIEALFESLGLNREGSALLADSLISADLEGISSHGVALVPMYVQRVRSGSVSVDALPRIVEDHGALVVMSAAHTFGQISSQVAMKEVVERARQHGVAVIAVRDAFHFGTAAYWARKPAEIGMIGFAFSNTRPLMPALGGAERVVGNNPMAIAFPAESGAPLVVDMAMSATAMGKIRLAQARGQSIPEGWATDSEGRPTTAPVDAINGMLLPAAGPKGFGLAVAVDLLCGALSGGAIGSAVRPLYGTLDEPYNCSHTFIAIDASRLGNHVGIADQVASFAEAIRSSRKAPGTDRIYAPGDLERSRRTQSSGKCLLLPQLIAELNGLADQAEIQHRI